MPCLAGARAALEAAAQGASSGRLALYIVWTNMLEGDNEARAKESARRLDPRSLASHFHDPDKVIGREVAAALGGEGEIAWDIYLLFPAAARWEDAPPTPAEWVHQLWESRWARRERYRTGEDLARSLRQAVSRLLLPDSMP